jgi:sugar phosphate isomerase/epimerase
MELGMILGELRRPTTEELFQAVNAYGFTQIQFGYTSVCGTDMPETLDPGFVQGIGAQARANGIEIVAVSGTFNMIHPDSAVRDRGIERLEVIAESCQHLGCDFVTLCTGTRDPESMWRRHADNQTQSAWDDLLVSMESALAIAERHDVLLGIECEASNVVNTPERARELLDTFPSPRLKIIMDVANLFQWGEARAENVRPIMDNAFALLGADIQLAHGKDIQAGEGLAFTHAGNGILDFGYYVDKLRACGYTGGMVLHGIKEERYMAESLSFMRGIMARRAR